MKHIETPDSMSEFLQQQPQNLTLASHKLGIHQLRIMSRVVEQMQPFMSMKIDHTKDTQDVWIDLNVSELVVANNTKPLRQAFDGLMKKVVHLLHYIEDEDKYMEIGTPLIKEYKYKQGESVAKVQISGSLLPQLVDLARGYTRYSLQVAFTTSSPNTFKLYQYFAHFRDKKLIQCNLDMLRKWLKLEDKYTKPAHIKQWILDPAMQELKDKADVWFDIAKRVTKGRKFVGWKFNIYTKKPRKTKPKSAPIEQLSDAQLEAEIRARDEETKKLKQQKAKRQVAKMEQANIDELVNFFKLSEKQAEKLIAYQKQDYGKRQVVGKLLFDIKNKQGVNNIGAYTVQVLTKQLGLKL